jgi:hypothetical protein
MSELVLLLPAWPCVGALDRRTRPEEERIMCTNNAIPLDDGSSVVYKPKILK